MHCIVLLGLVFDIRAMTVDITEAYRQEVIDLMERDWSQAQDFLHSTQD